MNPPDPSDAGDRRWQNLSLAGEAADRFRRPAAAPSLQVPLAAKVRSASDLPVSDSPAVTTAHDATWGQEATSVQEATTAQRVTTAHGPSTAAGQATAADAGDQQIPLPFFWYDPPWQTVLPIDRQRLAETVGRWGVTVNIGSGELGPAASGGDRLPSLPATQSLSVDRPRSVLADVRWPAMVTRRSDRLGWCPSDAAHAQLVELRLGVTVNDSLGGGYSEAQWRMWQGDQRRGDERDERPESATVPLARPGDVSGAVAGAIAGAGARPRPGPFAFPPECERLADLSLATEQLRSLGAAAIYWSCDERDFESVLPHALAAEADGIIVRFGRSPERVLERYRRWQATVPIGQQYPRLWLAGRLLGAEETVKCLMLGASAVSISALCDRWLAPDRPTAAATAVAVGGGQPPAADSIAVEFQRAVEGIRDQISGWMRRLSVESVDGLAAAVAKIGPLD